MWGSARIGCEPACTWVRGEPVDRSGLNLERRGNGDPVVLLHGIGGELGVWGPAIEPLSRVRDTIAIDLPGFGSSPALTDVAPTPAALAAAVGALLDGLGIDSAHIVGNSLGAWVALELARVGRADSVLGLCPAGLWAAPVLDPGAATRATAHRVVRRLGPLPRAPLLNSRARWIALRPFAAHPDRIPVDAAWRMIASHSRPSACDATRAAVRERYFDHLDDIEVPVLLAFGERDRLVRPVCLPACHWESMMLPDCGHIPTWDNPQLITKLILQHSRPRTPAVTLGG